MTSDASTSTENEGDEAAKKAAGEEEETGDDDDDDDGEVKKEKTRTLEDDLKLEDFKKSKEGELIADAEEAKKEDKVFGERSNAALKEGFGVRLRGVAVVKEAGSKYG